MNNTLKQLLSIYWLRPETALWRQCDIIAMKNFKFISPSIEIGSGDGLFSFIRSGGNVNIKYDVFSSTSNIDKFFKNVDVYDHYNKKTPSSYFTNPKYKIDIGFDHKKSLLLKSKPVGIYKDLKKGDANKILPFESESFQSLFSNIIYWLREPNFAISEISRVLAPNGKACLMLPDESFLECSFYNNYYLKKKDKNFKFLNLIDRGRFSSNIKHAKSQKKWEKLFRDNNLRVFDHNKHLSKEIVYAWDIGFRPFFPMLKKMSDNLKISSKEKVKKEWISNLFNYAKPLIELEKNNLSSRKTFHCYVLEKR